MKTTKTTKTTQRTMPKSVMVKGRSIRPMYTTSEITSRTNKNLWVTFVAGKPNNGLVYTMVLTRDDVRSCTARMFGTNITNIRSQRVGTYRKGL